MAWPGKSKHWAYMTSIRISLKRFIWSINLLNWQHSVSNSKVFYILVPRALNQTHPKQRWKSSSMCDIRHSGSDRCWSEHNKRGLMFQTNGDSCLKKKYVYLFQINFVVLCCFLAVHPEVEENIFNCYFYVYSEYSL